MRYSTSNSALELVMANVDAPAPAMAWRAFLWLSCTAADACAHLLSQDALARQADAAVHDYGLAAQLAANVHAADAGWDRRSPANGLSQNLVQVSACHPTRLPLLMAVSLQDGMSGADHVALVLLVRLL
jgi:hypothetical protein